jgi:hypothetical protein
VNKPANNRVFFVPTFLTYQNEGVHGGTGRTALFMPAKHKPHSSFGGQGRPPYREIAVKGHTSKTAPHGGVAPLKGTL